MAKKNEYVRIHRAVLEAVERTGKLPENIVNKDVLKVLGKA